MYNTATGQGLTLRVPDAPFVVETFCMGDHGIVSGYRRDSATGDVEADLLSPVNLAADAWGLPVYRATLYAFCDALTGILITGVDDPSGDVRPAVHSVMEAFWRRPTQPEAEAWGTYPYDSDPAGTAVRPLAQAFTRTTAPSPRGDRAWVAGSLALSTPAARASAGHAVDHPKPHHARGLIPATD